MVLGYCSQNKIYTVSMQKVLEGCVIVSNNSVATCFIAQDKQN